MRRHRGAELWQQDLLVLALRDPREPRTAIAGGAAFGAALLMKPTFSPLIVILFGATLALRLAPYLRDRKQWTPAACSCLIVGVLAILIAGPHHCRLCLQRSYDKRDRTTARGVQAQETQTVLPSADTAAMLFWAGSAGTDHQSPRRVSRKLGLR
jgi:4-amino-4-deoxy-L-arabinose transferase-like glycosyltransferase